MKRLCTIILLLLISGVLFSQKSSLQIDTTYFILGTLDDYNGRTLYSEVSTRIDRFYSYEYPLVQKVDSLLIPIIKDYHRFMENDSSGFQLFSNQFSINLNSKYDFFDTHSRTMNFDTIYYGKLKNNIFHTDRERISFLIGAYVRFGNNNKDTFSISVPNSASKIKICESLLKKLECKEVVYTIKDNYIPAGHSVSFLPTKKLKGYFQSFSYLRIKISQNFDKKIIEMIGEENFKKIKFAR